MSKYVIIDAEAIQNRIEELIKEISESLTSEQKMLLTHELNVLTIILSNSTPLIPEIEKIKDNLFQKLRYWREDIHSEDQLYDLIDEELEVFLKLKT